MYERIIQSDPTLRFLLREAQIDSKNFDHQVNCKISAAKIALHKYIDRLSKEA